MIVWGGCNAGNPCSTFSNAGGEYEPNTDTWKATSIIGAPVPRIELSLVWDGTGMIVWGGYDGVNNLNTGGIYYPDMGIWDPTSISSTPQQRSSHRAIWAGNKMIVWGGGDSVYLNTGAIYSPTNIPDYYPIVYASNEYGNYDIFKMSADGTKKIRLTTDVADERYPIWSPDSSKIAYSKAPKL
jgi:hypothetical protein